MTETKYKTLIGIGTALIIGGTAVYLLSHKPNTREDIKQRQATHRKSVEKIAQEGLLFGEEFAGIPYAFSTEDNRGA